MKKQVKTQIGKDDNILWVSKAGNCIAFKSVPGYQPMTMETSNELWAYRCSAHYFCKIRSYNPKVNTL